MSNLIRVALAIKGYYRTHCSGLKSEIDGAAVPKLMSSLPVFQKGWMVLKKSRKGIYLR
jgi:hypothetical protein